MTNGGISHLSSRFITILIRVAFSCCLQQHTNVFGFMLTTVLTKATSRNTASSSSVIINMSTSDDSNNNDGKSIPRWCPEEQIYIGGVVPESAEVSELIKADGGYLRIFGYGSLCWNPGSRDEVLANPQVTSCLGRAKGYRRCWAQKSTDHRGTTKFPGIVCTLLSDSEVRSIIDSQQSTTSAAAADDAHNQQHHEQQLEPTMTEGVIYLIPPNLVDACLEELDFREKGGYARDVIDVIEDASGELHQALLYRGTPDNPAFWNRALLDLNYAAAIMSVAHGPSGPNDVYLRSLDTFLAKAHTIAAETDDTNFLADMVTKFQTNLKPYFLFGCGSNQHNQLHLGDLPNNAANLQNNQEDCHQMTEILLSAKRVDNDNEDDNKPKAIYAGGGHSALLTTSGKFYLWGWNESGQCGSSSTTIVDQSTNANIEDDANNNSSIPKLVHCLPNIDVDKAALGFSHTLVIEKETNQLYTFGSNERGQVNGNPSSSSTKICQPTIPDFLKDEEIMSISAGLFHSAAVTKGGELITFGCSRFGQAMSSKNLKGDAWIDRWSPPSEDGSAKVVDVVCGRRHTIVIDNLNRLWSFGENKYGQLGRPIDGKFDPAPALVDLNISKDATVYLSCGWSHNVIRVEVMGESKDGDEISSRSNVFYGWGRNDKGQLGTGDKSTVTTPQTIFDGTANKLLQDVACSSESTIVIDTKGKIYGCGWNEHGNLGTGNVDDQLVLHPTIGEKVVGPPTPTLKTPEIAIAAGGAHFLAMVVETT